MPLLTGKGLCSSKSVGQKRRLSVHALSSSIKSRFAPDSLAVNEPSGLRILKSSFNEKTAPN